MVHRGILRKARNVAVDYDSLYSYAHSFPWKEGTGAVNAKLVLCLLDFDLVILKSRVHFWHFSFHLYSLTVFYIFKCTSTMYYIPFLYTHAIMSCMMLY